MNIRLMDFQEEYVVELTEKLKKAKRYVAEGETEAVLLSAPTGSGKTVMMTALIESVFMGVEGFASEPDAVFLWLSDQPELNEQSRKRIFKASGTLRAHQLKVIGPDFDEEVFEGGHVYFLNYQKLGKDKNLTTKGDNRTWTIWNTIENSSKRLNDRFYIVIDEAHRGMNKTSAQETEAITIVQKFLLGSKEISPISLIIGISATPDRFVKLVGTSERHLYKVNVDVEKVRQSGLLKERLVVRIPDDKQPNDWSLLKAAVYRWKVMRDEWHRYCVHQKLDIVSPIMVIQVEDGTTGKITKTDLELAVSIIEEEVGSLKDEDLAHSFQEDKELLTNSHRIRHLEASKIDADDNIKFIFFKMALTTGWDCPRAEVMMSFRRAQDATLIAQLIGRMVRTPLARKVEGNESLNDVHLYLPYYDKVNLNAVIEKLKGDSENVPATEIKLASDLIELRLNEFSYSEINRNGESLLETDYRDSLFEYQDFDSNDSSQELGYPISQVKKLGLQERGSMSPSIKDIETEDQNSECHLENPLTKEFEQQELNSATEFIAFKKDDLLLTDQENSLYKVGESNEVQPPIIREKPNSKGISILTMDIFSSLSCLPTYTFRQGRKIPDIRRLLRFSYLLTVLHDIDKEALADSRSIIINTLIQKRNQLLQANPEFRQAIEELSVITVKPLIIDQSTFEVRESVQETIEVTEKNVDDLFRLAKQRLGNELCLEYLRKNYDESAPYRAKLELFLLLQREEIWSELQSTARSQIKTLRDRNHSSIANLPSSKRQVYDEIWASARIPEAGMLVLTDSVSLPKSENGRIYKKHLFSDTNGDFRTELGNWEEEVLSRELEGCLAWLRNVPRKSWALCYVYEYGGEWKPGYPDFIIIRRGTDGMVIDLLEPHTGSLADAAAKAKGLASFARDHGLAFGRIEMQRVEDRRILRLDFNNPEIRIRALRLNNNQELDNLFEDYACL
ncbi:DEAD/DEAH box helicase [Paenibacillus sp. RS8]|uniref:DEAD/DEAH box helicase n=1 Tax=Paenibacillus sp. RS8 TaxID=3242681 RepID=UPI0035BFC00C